MKTVAEELRSTIEQAAPRLLLASAEQTTHRPQPGKWSALEILGHLIDSASHNHRRFVLAQLRDDLVFAGYEQDAWVRVQRYQEASWPELVNLWRTYNLHVARLIESVPEEIRERPRPRHNLHQIAWQPVPESQPATLGYFMADYLAHLQHHLAQIWKLLEGSRA